jgi:integrase
VTPDTIMRRHRHLIALKSTFEPKRVGRPGLMKAIKELIVRMATENSGWGSCRIRGELKSVGQRAARTTIANVLKQNGVKPAPDRPSSWRSLLKARWGQVAAADFFTAEVWTPLGLKTFYVLFVIDLKSRCVQLMGITRNPNAVKQFARWAVISGPASEDPLLILGPLKAKVDRRRERYSIDAVQLRRLIQRTHDGPPRAGPMGPQRALLYWLAVETGFRANELAGLRVVNFDLSHESASVTLPAALSKHRNDDVLPSGRPSPTC